MTSVISKRNMRNLVQAAYPDLHTHVLNSIGVPDGSWEWREQAAIYIADRYGWRRGTLKVEGMVDVIEGKLT